MKSENNKCPFCNYKLLYIEEYFVKIDKKTFNPLSISKEKQHGGYVYKCENNKCEVYNELLYTNNNEFLDEKPELINE